MRWIGIFVVLIAVGGAAGYWLSAVGTAEAARIDPDDSGAVARGKAIYARECASCHGKNLEGQVPDWKRRLPDGSIPAPPHDETGHTWHHNGQELFDVTKLARLEASGGAFSSNMPGFGDRLSDRDIWDVLSYIKSRWPEQVQRRHDEIERRSAAQRGG